MTSMLSSAPSTTRQPNGLVLRESSTLLIPEGWQRLRESALEIPRDWFGKEVKSVPSFALLKDPEWLWFAAFVDSAPHYDSSNKCNQFIEGLWEADLAEIFVAKPDGTPYQEFNLSPGGAWWSCLFSSYRTRDPEHFHRPVVECFSASGEERWSCALRARLDTLDVPIDHDTRANVTFIISGRYFSFNSPPACEPDYHRAELLLPVRLAPHPPLRAGE